LRLSDGWWMASKPQGDWAEMRALILAELKRLNDGIDDMKVKLDKMHSSDLGDIRTEIAVLKVKAAIWAAGASVIGAGLSTALINMVFHK
jgi:hypothetical protein